MPRTNARGMTREKFTVVPRSMAVPKVSGGSRTMLKKTAQMSVQPEQRRPVISLDGSRPGKTNRIGMHKNQPKRAKAGILSIGLDRESRHGIA